MLNFPLFIKCVEKYMSINKYSKMEVKHHINEIKNLIYDLELDITRYNPKQRVSWLF
jgi:hypothetical protein